MKYIDRLEGTELAADTKVRLICGAFDLCDSTGGDMPKIRDLCSLLDVLRTDNKKTSTKTVTSLLDKMVSTGIISLVSGKGRTRNEYGTPENTNLIADKKADLDRRKEEFRKDVWKKLNEGGTLKEQMMNGTANKHGVDKFIEFYSRGDEEFVMLKDRISAESGSKFSIKARWNKWKDKRVNAVQQSVASNQSDEDRLIRERNVERNVNMRKKNKELDGMLEEWMKKKGVSELTPQLISEFKAEHNINS